MKHITDDGLVRGADAKGRMHLRLTWMLALRDSKYDATAKHVGLTLATHMDSHGGSCFPGRELLATETSLDIRTIDRALLRLETGQWLHITRSKGRRPNQYQATIPHRGTESRFNGGRESRLPRQSAAPTLAQVRAKGGTESPELFMTSSKSPSTSPSDAAATEPNDDEPVTDTPEPSLRDEEHQPLTDHETGAYTRLAHNLGFIKEMP